MQVLHVISFLIERTGSQIKPYASSLIQYLQTLWQEAQEHNMLKCAILTTLVHLVQVRFRRSLIRSITISVSNILDNR